MTDLRFVTKNGGDKIIESATVDALAEGLRGRLLRREDDGYDQARRVWNGIKPTV
jgi:hypothetical protein